MQQTKWFERKFNFDTEQNIFPSIIERLLGTPVSNIEEMNAIISTFQSRLPHKLVINSEPEFHNSIFRTKWKMDNEGAGFSYGTFVGEFNADGKIARVFCFIDVIVGSLNYY
jgi:hypothetical protein